MKKFFMITLQGRKWINELLSLVSTGIYSLDCSGFNFESLYVNGTLGAIKTSMVVSGDSLYTYYYDATNKVLYIRLNASDLTTKKNFIVNHVVGLTNAIDFAFNIDPDSPNTREIIFESRVVQAPSFGQSQENNLNGVLSLSSSQLQVDNTDQRMDVFFTDNDSFKGCTVKVWKCDETPSSREVVYIGTVSRISGDVVLSFSTEDFLNRLDTVLYSRDTYASSIARGRNQDTPESQALTKIHRVYGRNSSFKYKYISASNELNIKALDIDGMPEAYCTSYDPTLSASVNRTWETGIIEDMTGSMELTDTVTTVLTVGTGAGTFAKLIEIASGSYDNYSVGDQLSLNGGADFARVIEVFSNGMYISPNYAAITAGQTIKSGKVSSLILFKDGVEFELRYGADYAVGAPGAGLPIPITLTSTVESSRSIGFIDPAIDKIYYKLKNIANLDSYKHGSQIKKILLTEFSSGELNLTSFDDANTALDLDLCFMNPPLNSDFITKRELIERLVVSSFGYLYLDENFKIAYGNFKTPAPTESITDTEVKKGSVSHEIDYNDVYQSVTFTSTEFTDVFTIESEQATYLHKTNKQKDFPHLCDIVSVNKPTAHFKKIAQILTMKRIISQLSVYELPLRVGEERILSASKKLGNTDVVVLSLDETDKEKDLRVAQFESAKGNMKLITNGFSMGNI